MEFIESEDEYELTNTSRREKGDDVRVCLFDNYCERLYVFAKPLSDKGVQDVLNVLLTQRKGMYVDPRSSEDAFYRAATRPYVIVRSESEFPSFLREGFDRRIADSAAHTFSHVRPAIYESILRRCYGEETTQEDADVMKHTISFRPFAFRTKRFVEHLTGLFDAWLASENLRVRRLGLKTATVGSDLLSGIDGVRSVDQLLDIITVGALGLTLPVTCPFWIANRRKKKRLEKEIGSVRSSVEISLSVECVQEAKAPLGV